MAEQQRLRPVAVEGGGGMPPEPDWSSTYTDVLDIAAAHERWGIVTRAMQEAQTITIENGDAIERLVHAHVLYRRALNVVAERGAVMKNKRNSTMKYNPHYGVMRQMADYMVVMESELGLSPVRRNKAGKTQKRTNVAQAADNYLKRVG